MDLDTLEIDEEHVTHFEGASITSETARPLDIEARGTEEIIAALRRCDETVYRAEVLLGDVVPLSYGPAETNTDGLWLGACMLSFGPILIGGLEDDEATLVSWTSFSVGGQGYLWPRKSYEVRADLERMRPIQAAMSLCRQTWPVPAQAADEAARSQLRQARRELGDLWAYEQVDQPRHWAWVVGASG